MNAKARTDTADVAGILASVFASDFANVNTYLSRVVSTKSSPSKKLWLKSK